jgi:hypothetical protein
MGGEGAVLQLPDACPESIGVPLMILVNNDTQALDDD